MTVANDTSDPWRSERRGGRRSNMHAGRPAYAILANGAYADIHMLDLSIEGCSFECPVELHVGDRLKLSVHDRGIIDAEVQHYSDGKAGVIFTSAAAARKAPWPRKGARERVLTDVSLRRPGRNAYQVTAFDVSPEGCKVEFVDRPAIDEHVWIRFPGLEPVEGRICWVQPPHAGISFVNDIHAAVFDLLLPKLKPGG